MCFCVCVSVLCLCGVLVMYCVMVHGLCLYTLCVCVGGSFNVLVCGVCVLLFDVVWFAVVCDLLSVALLVDVCVLCVVYCVML